MAYCPIAPSVPQLLNLNPAATAHHFTPIGSVAPAALNYTPVPAGFATMNFANNTASLTAAHAQVHEWEEIWPRRQPARPFRRHLLQRSALLLSIRRSWRIQYGTEPNLALRQSASYKWKLYDCVSDHERRNADAKAGAAEHSKGVRRKAADSYFAQKQAALIWR